MKKRYLLLTLLAFGLDRLSKIWAAMDLAHRQFSIMPVLRNVLQFRYIENDGIAFSLFAGNSPTLIIITAILMVVVALFMVVGKGLTNVQRMCLAVVLGGGLGNLYDRIAFGAVIDFIEPMFVNFAIFNVADIFVVCGMIICALTLIFEEKKRGEYS